MRIAFVTRKSWPAVGGAEAHLRLLARDLAKDNDVSVLAQRIHDGEIRPIGDVVAPRRAFEPFTDGGVRVQPLRISAFARLAVAADVAAVLASMRLRGDRQITPSTYDGYAAVVGTAMANRLRGVDLLHVICGGNLASAAMRAARLLGVPAVVTPFAHPGQHDDDPASAAAYRTADAVLATTETDASVYRGLGVDPDRIEITGVCSEGLTSGGGSPLRERGGIGGPLVVFVGVRRPHKGINLLLEAIPAVRARRPDVRFAFIGPGEPLGGGPEVIDVGVVDDEVKAAWIEAADVLCLPSAYESFGLVVTEAWSVGTPVVTSDLPVLRELIGAGAGGLTAAREPAAFSAALLELIDHPQRAQAMGRAGHRFWQTHYRPELVAATHRRLYERLTARSTTPPGGAPVT